MMKHFIKHLFKTYKLTLLIWFCSLEIVMRRKSGLQNIS